MSLSNSVSFGGHSPASDASRPFGPTPQDSSNILSAIIIQCCARRFLARRHAAVQKNLVVLRKKQEREEGAAVLLQAITRGVLTRRRNAFQKNAQKLIRVRQKQETAACIIQTSVRSHQQHDRVARGILDRRARNEELRREEAARVVQLSFRCAIFRRSILAAMDLNREERRRRNVMIAARSKDEETLLVAQEQQFARQIISTAVAQMKINYLRKEKAIVQRFYAQKSIAQEKYIVDKAARCIQLGYRCGVARREASIRRGEAKKVDDQVRKEEGVAVLKRFYFKVSGRRRIDDRIQGRMDRERAKKHHDSAALIQAHVKGRQQHRKYMTFVQVEQARKIRQSATRIQCMVRRRHAKVKYSHQQFKRQVKEDTAVLHEASTTIQRLRRGQLSRRQTTILKTELYFSSQVAALGRGFLARRSLGVDGARDQAAKVLQKRARAFIATCYTQRLRKADLAEKQKVKRNQAAVMIQRTWLKYEGLLELQERKILHAIEDRAARIIQRRSKVLIARVQLRRWEEQEEEEVFEVQLEAAVILVQSCVRRFIAMGRLSVVKNERRLAMDLVARVFLGFQDRVFHGKRRLLIQAKAAVAVIQVGWRQHLDIRKAKETMLLKRGELNVINREKNAATLIQQRARGFLGKVAFDRLKAQRELAARKLTRQARVFLAQLRTQALRQEVLEHRCARKIQVRWQEVKVSCRERRETRQMEQRLVEMDVVAVLRGEHFHRRRIGAEEEEQRAAFNLENEVHLTETAKKFKAKMEAWHKRSPPDLQQDAAVRVQSVFRGFTTRKENLGENSPIRGALVRNNTFTRARRDILPALTLRSTTPTVDLVLLPSIAPNSGRRSSRERPGSAGDLPSGRRLAQASVAEAPPLTPRELLAPLDAPKYDIEGSDTMMWFSWLAERPSVNKRSFERLLQREAAGRRKILEDFEADFTGRREVDVSKSSQKLVNTVTTPASSPTLSELPTKKSAVRHLAALSTAEQLTRRANTALSMHPTTSRESTTTVSRLVTSMDDDRYQQQHQHQQQHRYPSSADSRRRRTVAPFAESGGESRRVRAGSEAENAIISAAVDDSAAADGVAISVDGVADLRHQNLTEALLRPLLHTLRSASNLQVLLLDGNPLRDTATVDIGDLLIHNSSLRHLSLASTTLSDIGMSHLVAALRRNSTLVSCDISGTCVSERYRAHLCNLLDAKAKQRKQCEEERAIAAAKELVFGRSLTPSVEEGEEETSSESIVAGAQDQSAAAIRRGILGNSTRSSVKLPPMQRYVPPAAKSEFDM